MYSAICTNDKAKLTLIVEEGIASGLLMDALKMDYSFKDQENVFKYSISP